MIKKTRKRKVTKSQFAKFLLQDRDACVAERIARKRGRAQTRKYSRGFLGQAGKSGLGVQGVSSMKSRENLLRLKHFQVEDKTRQLTQIELMISEFSKMADELDNQIRLEEERSGISDTSHFAYPTFAKAARQRRDNLMVSIRDLTEKRDTAAHALEEAEEELKKAQKLESRDGSGGAEGGVDEQAERRATIG